MSEKSSAVSMAAGQLAEQIGASLIGDAGVQVDHISSMDAAESGAVTYLKDKAYLDYLSGTKASVVILTEAFADQCPVTALVVEDPYVAYARAAQLLHPQPVVQGGHHSAAVIDPSATIAESAYISPGAVIEADVVIGERAYIGPNCVVRTGARIGDDTRLMAMVHVGTNCVIGERGIFHPGVVIGGDGFGFANENGVWIKIPQIGAVVIGDDVEVGANSCIDCGAINNTIVGNGVKIDNFIQIGHNAEIGDHSIMVTRSGVSGSTVLGKHCTLAGGVGVAGHIHLAEGTVVTAMSMVTHSIDKAGVYSSGVSVQDAGTWRRNHARLHNLDKTIKELRAEIKALKQEINKE
jgi:UDP-3-O-[3-hydroxymyristoyl] glucosamine N-acyltransferase